MLGGNYFFIMKIIKIIIFFSTFCGFSQNQRDEKYLQVSYELLLNVTEINRRNDENNSNIDITTKKIVSDAYSVLEMNQNLLSFELIIKNREAVFYKNQVLFLDDIDVVGRTLLKVFHDRYFYSTSITSEVIQVRDFLGKSYLIKSNYDEFEWEITQESKKIQDYLVFKAIGISRYNSKQITAWFAPELNYNFGPDRTSGLPGLVLEYILVQYSIICKKIDFQPSIESLKKVKEPSGEIITQENLDKLILETRKSSKN